MEVEKGWKKRFLVGFGLQFAVTSNEWRTFYVLWNIFRILEVTMLNFPLKNISTIHFTAQTFSRTLAKTIKFFFVRLNIIIINLYRISVACRSTISSMFYVRQTNFIKKFPSYFDFVSLFIHLRKKQRKLFWL